MSTTITTNVIKRNGEEVHFDLDKIVNAIKAANNEVDRLHQLNDYQIMAIADTISQQIHRMTHAVNVEDIQDMVETGIMEMLRIMSGRLQISLREPSSVVVMWSFLPLL